MRQKDMALAIHRLVLLASLRNSKRQLGACVAAQVCEHGNLSSTTKVRQHLLCWTGSQHSLSLMGRLIPKHALADCHNKVKDEGTQASPNMFARMRDQLSGWDPCVFSWN